MSQSLVDKIVRAVLYEGYILYPYRPSVKTQQRWTFGGIFPRSYSQATAGTDPDFMQLQCLIAATDLTRISLTFRFLHLTDRSVEQGPAFTRLQSLRVAEKEYQTWQEAIERQVQIDDLPLNDLLRNPLNRIFSFDADENIETLPEADPPARLVRHRRQINGNIQWSAEPLTDNLFRLTARVENQTRCAPEDNLIRDRALMQSFASSHLVLHIKDGSFISLTDPPSPLVDFASQCQNTGCWPVLVGECGQTDTLLASPIILPDYPQIAPESPGDLFDGCEIDEILTLRIMTLTEEEKRQAVAVDPLAADMMARTESLAREQLMNLHGALRTLQPTTSGSNHG